MSAGEARAIALAAAYRGYIAHLDGCAACRTTACTEGADLRAAYIEAEEDFGE
ncbi:hypothetical protein [Streptomyces nitrosporeus]|uniref:hypothetical protein n=1 Tax=Streptomyces nitrosporeus TaxID=28894 RepID=UPI00142F07FF|nr:hypothetical protein [Streptomyces nitrosporeus]GGY80996.1 hypothetical protein GCM10010327_09540 [Streptomyces nitrosporeus]